MSNSTTHAQPPAERFNLAQHLIDRNRDRPAKDAYIDDQGSLSFGELARRIRAKARQSSNSDRMS